MATPSVPDGLIFTSVVDWDTDTDLEEVTLVLVCKQTGSEVLRLTIKDDWGFVGDFGVAGGVWFRYILVVNV